MKIMSEVGNSEFQERPEPKNWLVQVGDFLKEKYGRGTLVYQTSKDWEERFVNKCIDSWRNNPTANRQMDKMKFQNLWAFRPTVVEAVFDHNVPNSTIPIIDKDLIPNNIGVFSKQMKTLNVQDEERKDIERARELITELCDEASSETVDVLVNLWSVGEIDENKAWTVFNWGRSLDVDEYKKTRKKWSNWKYFSKESEKVMKKQQRWDSEYQMFKEYLDLTIRIIRTDKALLKTLKSISEYSQKNPQFEYSDLPEVELKRWLAGTNIEVVRDEGEYVSNQEENSHRILYNFKADKWELRISREKPANPAHVVHELGMKATVEFLAKLYKTDEPWIKIKNMMMAVFDNQGRLKNRYQGLRNFVLEKNRGVGGSLLMTQLIHCIKKGREYAKETKRESERSDEARVLIDVLNESNYGLMMILANAGILDESVI